ncbi:MAG: aminoacyl-tRNA hydrolase [Pseudomonadota bacterium]|nr:aminoacyl-tRNA hydrolase [Pseudomonadota bacterium]
MTIRAIIGLGNPGAEYASTRHNVGFWLIDRVVGSRAIKPDRRLHGELAQISLGGHALWLLKPSTFMNASGRAVAALASYYKLPPESLLVVHDELDLPPGTVRLKQGGGHGGHNGLRDIIRHLGAEFWRMRVGIGHPGHRDEVIGYVLSRASSEEQALIGQALERGVSVMPLLAAAREQQAMKELHSK